MTNGKVFTAVGLIAFLAMALGWSAWACAGELILHPTLTKELNGILHVSESLHKSLVEQDEEGVEIAIRDMIQEIDRARRVSTLARPHERAHLLRILEAARDHFELTKNAYGEERRAQLEDAFNQLVNLVRIYRLDRAYAIFFCPRDKASWVQHGGQKRMPAAKNPFRPETMRDCGIRVSR